MAAIHVAQSIGAFRLVVGGAGSSGVSVASAWQGRPAIRDAAEDAQAWNLPIVCPPPGA
jgi:hypothetical protein